jgi:hypothetical protein
MPQALLYGLLSVKLALTKCGTKEVSKKIIVFVNQRAQKAPELI